MFYNTNVAATQRDAYILAWMTLPHAHESLTKDQTMGYLDTIYEEAKTILYLSSSTTSEGSRKHSDP